MAMGRAHWGSRFGFVLAASGSAVGLGNLWKFPYVTWENNGGAFVLVYLLAVLVLGLPIMIAEIMVGRRAQLSAVPAFQKLGGRSWSIVGWIGVLAGTVILSYYVVIAGWSIRSLFQCLNWSYNGYVPPNDQDFSVFLADGWTQVGLSALFSLFTAAIVYRGVGAGIEKATKIMMPILCTILLYLVGTALTMEGRTQALTTMFVPDFTNFKATGVLEAVGQAFFSLSLGLGAMIAYGSYIKKGDSILRSSIWVVLLDTLFALFACVAMFTIIFSVPGLQGRLSGSTVGMLFITLPDLFYRYMAGGVVLAPLFFILVGFAALSSTISLGEVAVSLMIDSKGWSRGKATIICSSSIFLVSILAALSSGAVEPLSTVEIFPGKAGLLSTLDHLAANWLLPLGGLGITLFVGWKLGPKVLKEELGLDGNNPAFTVWLWIVRIIAPAAILALIIAVATGKDFS